MNSNSDDTKTQSNEKKAILDELWNEMQELGITDIKYTVLTIKDIDARHTQILEGLAHRDVAYEAELKRQQEVSCQLFILTCCKMENKRIEFAHLAQAFVDLLAQRRSTVEQLQGEPEVQDIASIT